MNSWVSIVVFVASALALAFAYYASPYQRSLRQPLPAFPAHTSAILAAIVALRGWAEALGAIAGLLAWLSTLIAAALVLWLTMRTTPSAPAR